MQNASLNGEIDNALDAYFSKNGGAGGNRPDVKLLVKDKYGKQYPVLIEYKGYKDRLIRLGSTVLLRTKMPEKNGILKILMDTR
ncbi:hypothetical protein ACNDUQ_002167 [Escherichia coli]